MAWTAPHLDANGFTVYAPPGDLSGRPSGVRGTVVYVSSSSGSNSNNGLSTATPKKYVQNMRTFTLASPASISAGAVYYDSSGNYLMVLENSVSSTTLVTTDSGTANIHAAPDTLTKYSGTGPAGPLSYAAVSSMVPGAQAVFAAAPGNSWMLFKRGDTFPSVNFETRFQDFNQTNGTSTAEPRLFSNYDPAFVDAFGDCIPNPQSSLAYPVLINSCNSNTWLRNHNTGYRTHFVGLDVAMGPSGRGAVSTTARSDDIRLEDCHFDGSGSPDPGNCITVSGDHPDQGPLTFHRIIVDNFTGQGVDGSGYDPWVFKQCIIDNNAVGDTGSRIHNIYVGGYNKPFLGVHWPGQTFDGCIISNDPSQTQWRNGGVNNNTAWLLNWQGHNTQTTFNNTSITNCVYMEPSNHGKPDGNCFGCTTGGYYQADRHNVDPIVVSNNILAHSIPTTTGGMIFERSSHRVTFSNNICYNWNSYQGRDDLLRFQIGNWSIYNSTGIYDTRGVYAGTISNGGSGYTPRFQTITNAYSGSSDQGMCVLTIPGYAAFGMSSGNGGGYFYVTGTGLVGLDNQIVRLANWAGSDTEWVVQNVPFSSLGGSYTGGSGGAAKAYHPYGASFTGGSGTDFVATMVVGPGGNVIHVNLAGSNGLAEGNAGYNYTVGNVLSSPGLNSAAGGSGFTYTVTEVCTITDGGGNIKDDSVINGNPTAYPQPNRTGGSYLNYLTSSSGHTTQDFITAAKTKLRKKNYDPLYLAESFNDYIRQGFGKTMIGSAYAGGAVIITLDALGNGTVGIPYNDSAAASGGTAPYTYTVVSGALPTGLSLNGSTGQVSGTPTFANTFGFTIRATDSASRTGEATYSLVIVASATGGPPLLDFGLASLTPANIVHICSSNPANYAAAVAASLGNKSVGAGNVFGPIADDPNGRKRTLNAVSAGTVTANGTATHLAVVDSVNQKLLVTSSFTAPLTVSTANTFTVASFDVISRAIP